jgi:hypothetical protein
MQRKPQASFETSRRQSGAQGAGADSNSEKALIARLSKEMKRRELIASKESAELRLAAMEKLPRQEPKPNPPRPNPTTAAPEPKETVYATATEDIPCEETGTKVASRGDRVLLLYPQHKMPNGDVRMFAKIVEPTSGQISFHKVLVYISEDGNGEESRKFKDFSS